MRIVLWLTAASLALMALIIYYGLPRIFATRNDSLAIRRSAEIQGCRAEYSSQVTSATADLNRLILDGLVAVAMGDDEKLASLVEPGEDGTTKATRARDNLQSAVQEYTDAIAQSRTDPGAFLNKCRSEH